MQRLLLYFLLSLPIFLQADEEQRFPFKLGIDRFDDQIVASQKRIISTLVAIANERKESSDLAQLCRTMAAKDLNEQLKDPQTLFLAQGIYNAIQCNEQVEKAFLKAKEAVFNQYSTRERADLWRQFRATAQRELADLRKQAVPHIKDPTPGSPNALVEFFERNKEVTLTNEQKHLYHAFCILFFTIQQNHRLVDVKSDDETMSHRTGMKD